MVAGNRIEFQGVLVSRKRRRLEIVLANGNLADVPSQCYVLGLFDGIAPSGAAHELDKRSDGLISDFISRHLLERGLGKVSLIPTNFTALPTDLVLFVGLGSFVDFNSSKQKASAATVVRVLSRLRIQEFATVLIGDTRIDRTGSSSLSNLIAGFLASLRDGDPEELMHRIIFVEFNESRYEGLKNEFYHLAATPLFDEIEIAFSELKVRPLIPLDNNLASAATMSTVSAENLPDYLVVADDASNKRAVRLRLSFLSSDGRGAVPSENVEIDRGELERILSSIDREGWGDSKEALEQFSEQLSPLLFPESFLSNLRRLRVGNRPLRVVHDAIAAKIPWEAVSIDGYWPAREHGLSRHFANGNAPRKWLQDRIYRETLDVLMVIDPTNSLAGAEVEGRMLSLLPQKNPRLQLRLEIRRGAEATKDRLMRDFESGRYDIVHFAGHARFDADDSKDGGLLCANEQILTGNDLLGLTSLPSLVFLNACQTGRISDAANITRRDSMQSSMTAAEAFLAGGLKLFLGTYWPVDDLSAKSFSETFYTSVINGNSIGKAVLDARNSILKLGLNDWANYLLYGDPGIVLKVANPTAEELC